MKPRTASESEMRLLVESGAVRGALVVRTGDKWAVVIQVGLSEITIASKREDVRLFAKLDTIAAWLREVGIKDFCIRG